MRVTRALALGLTMLLAFAASRASAQGVDVLELPLAEAFEPGFAALSPRGEAFLEGFAWRLSRTPSIRHRIRVYCGSRALAEALVRLLSARLVDLGVPAGSVDVEARVWSNEGPGRMRVPRVSLGFTPA